MDNRWGGHRPRKILRLTAENELRSLGFEPRHFTERNLGQWWCPPYGGPLAFLQWDRENPSYVDEEQLRVILEDFARYRPLNGGRH